MKSLVAAFGLAAFGAVSAVAGDWPEWRGPARDGASAETQLPSRWSPAGEGLAWKAPYGSRSTPVVFGSRLYLWNASVDTVKERDKVQERLLALDADTGKLIWEKRFNVFHTDVPVHRIGWASPSVDPATGNVYAFGVDGHLHALDAAGKVLWQRQLTEEYGEISTHGGRTVSPVIEGDLVIVSTLNSGWGDQSRGSNRYFAFDKKTGVAAWISTPQPKHYDTNYSTPTVVTVNGRRLLVVGGSDGTFYGIEATTGRPIWNLELSKRAILSSSTYRGTTVYLTHSEENLDTSEMGLIGVARRERGRQARAGQARVADVRLPGRLRLARDRRRASLPGGQRRGAGGVRARGRQEALGAPARHDPEGLARDRRRQALRGHRERQVLRDQADRGRAGDPRRGPARHGSGAGGDHRVAGRGARARVPRDDGRALRDRPEGSAKGRGRRGAEAGGTRRAGRAGAWRSSSRTRCSRSPAR